MAVKGMQRGLWGRGKFLLPSSEFCGGTKKAKCENQGGQGETAPRVESNAWRGGILGGD
jgi:hypothetical protein